MFCSFPVGECGILWRNPKEGEGNTKKKGQMKVNEENGRLTAALKDMVGIGKEANGG